MFDTREAARHIADARTALLQSDWSGAQASIGRVIETQPANPEALHLLGLALAGKGEFGPALSCLERAASAEPDQISWRLNLGELCAATGDWRRSAEVFSGILLHHPRDPAALTALGRALLKINDVDESIRVLRLAVEIQPGAWESVRGLAQALIAGKRKAEAAHTVKSFLDSYPGHVPGHWLMAEMYLAGAACDEARSHLESLLLLEPDDRVRFELAKVCWDLGDVNAALRYSRPKGSIALDSLHAYLHLYDPSHNGYSLRETCERIASGMRPTAPMHFHAPSGDRQRPLRIGYLSGDLIAGSPFFFLSSLIGNHDRERFDIFCYHTRPWFDGATKWYQDHSFLRDCRELGDDSLQAQIRGDEIDILVDLSGFFPEHRLHLFAGRAAPVQVSYPNCASTTGVGAMDYIFTDRWTCPPGCEGWYTECPVLLPGGYLSYTPPRNSPPVASLPARRNGFITFGLFQQVAKLNSSVLDAIAEILFATPESRLLIFSSSRTLSNPRSRTSLRIRSELQRRGVGPECIRMEGSRRHNESLRLIGEADIALDSFPFQGQTTTCESLWMGVSVVALSGESHVARVGTAILQRVGLENLAARTPEEYIRIATDLAGDLDRLEDLRAGMRARLHRSALLDGRRLAQEVEDSYESMWRTFCAGTHLKGKHVEHHRTDEVHI